LDARKNPTASAANSGSSGLYANHYTTEAVQCGVGNCVMHLGNENRIKILGATSQAKKVLGDKIINWIVVCNVF
jgi:hypothetical protein